MLILWYTMELVWIPTIWSSCLPDERWHFRKSLMRLRTNSRRSSGHGAREHLLMAGGCSFAAAVTQCDMLTCVFKSIFPGQDKFLFKGSQCRSLLMLAACHCHLGLFLLFSAGGSIYKADVYSTLICVCFMCHSFLFVCLYSSTIHFSNQ